MRNYKKMNKAIRSVSGISGLHSYLEEEYMNEEGNAEIHIYLSEDTELFDPLSYGKQQEIHQDIIDYIDRKTNLIPAQIPLVTIFHGRKLSEEDKESVRHCIKEHYYIRLQDKAWDVKSNQMTILWMFLIGVAFITLYFYLTLFREDGTFLELISVIGSVSLWEAAYRFLIDRKELHREMYEITQSLEQNIVFED